MTTVKENRSSEASSGVSRRKAIYIIGGAAVAAAVAGGAYLSMQQPPAPPSQTTAVQTATEMTTAPPTGPVDQLQFTIWSWAVDFQQYSVAEYNKKMKAINSPVNVTMLDIPQEVYRESLIARFGAGTPTDVFYNDDGTVSEFYAAGWLGTWEDYHPEVRDYLPDILDPVKPAIMAPPLQESTLWETGKKMLTIPYYSNYKAVFYNKQILEKAQIDAPPNTWDEWLDQALKIKQKGLCEYPINIILAVWQFWESLDNFVFANKDGKFFDKDLNPIFLSESSAVYRTLKWWIDGIYKYKVIDPTIVNMDDTAGDLGFANGKWAYMLDAQYSHPLLNDPGFSPIAKEYPGYCGMMRNPSGSGDVHTGACWIRPYGLSTVATKGTKEHMDNVWNFTNYEGGRVNDRYEADIKNGKLITAVRWMQLKGIPTAYKSLYSEPEVQAAFAKAHVDPDLFMEQYLDSKLKDGMLTPWWGKWSGVYGIGPARSALEAVILNRKSIMDGLNDIASLWQNLKASYGY